MTVASGNFPELLWPGLKKIFGDSYGKFPVVYKKIFTIDTSKLVLEKDQGVTSLGLAGIKEQGDSIPYTDPGQGFQKEYVHTVYGLGASVTKEMWSDEQYRYIKRIPKFLAESMGHTEETVHATVLNNAFTTETTADGVSLINASHPNAVGAGTQSNQPSTAADLTQTSLEQAFIDIMGYTDDQGKRIMVQPKKLIVPRQLRFVAEKILQTKNEVGSADNTVNPMNGALELVTWVYLTDADAWYVQTDQNDAGLTSYTRWDTEAERDNEFDTKNLKFSVTRRWSQGATDWRCMYASPGA